MDSIKILMDKLKAGKEKFQGSYFIPEVWNCFGFKDYQVDPNRPEEISVNPYHFYLEGLKFITSQSIDKNLSYSLSFQESTDDPLYQKIIYSTFLRTLTTWNHYPCQPIFPGTFLKAIALLPYLKDLGVEIIYLLPIFASGEKYKKGELGSPYAIKNFYQLDQMLHDPLLGVMNYSLLETEFKAFVESSHLMGLQVMVDFVFRTASRDNDLLSRYPEWFYWIRLKDQENFSPPLVKRVKKFSPLNQRNLDKLYKSEGIKEYLAKFTPSPKEINPFKWQSIQKKSTQNEENILGLIEKEFGITTVPGFSDALNDQQPPWGDVTYLQFYFDHHKKAQKYVEPDQAPYLLQDVASLNLYRGEIPNQKLWEYIINIIPYYAQKFGIDGARIDMGHALPPDLNQAIIEKAKATKEDFILWSEEFNPKNSGAAKDYGYDFITGDLWHLYKGVEKKGFCQKLFGRLLASDLPLTGALEIPDTPRVAWYYQEKSRIELLVFLNYFLPNLIPLINNGMELMERQPMNLGLDNTEEGRFVLEEDDPMYGKLAFFDNYRLHWGSKERKFMLPLLKKAALLRKRFIHLIKADYLANDCYRLIRKKLIHFTYFVEEQEKLLIFLANKDFWHRTPVILKELLPYAIRKKVNNKLNIALAAGELVSEEWLITKKYCLNPGEVIIGFVD